MPRKIADTKKMTHEEWLALRKSSVGGSDAGTCVGRNQYSSLYTLYADKKGLSKPKEDNEAMRQGRDFEDMVARRYMEETGRKIRNDNFMYASDDYDFITANVDRRIVGENGGLECKTMQATVASGYNFDAGEVPENYYCQCQHYMYVMGWDFMDLAILVYGRAFHVVRIDRRDDFIEDLIKAEVDFWTNYVMKDRMPEPDGSEASLETLKELYPDAEKNTEIAIPGLDSLIRDYKSEAELEKIHKERKLRAQEIICAKLGTNEVGIGNAFGCSWKEQSKPSIPAAKLKAKYPAIYNEMVEVSKYRVFRTRNLTKKEAAK